MKAKAPQELYKFLKDMFGIPTVKLTSIDAVSITSQCLVSANVRNVKKRLERKMNDFI